MAEFRLPQHSTSSPQAIHRLQFAHTLSPVVCLFVRIANFQIASLECDGRLPSRVDWSGRLGPVLGVGLDPVVTNDKENGHTTKVVGKLVEGVVGDHVDSLWLVWTDVGEEGWMRGIEECFAAVDI